MFIYGTPVKQVVAIYIALFISEARIYTYNDKSELTLILAPLPKNWTEK